MLRASAAFLLAGWLALAAAQGQPPLPTVQLGLGMHVVTAEVAANFGERMQGLMHRPSMPQNHGMLFVFERAERQCFWMRNTLIPLSIAFIDDEGAIVNLADMQPKTEDAHCSAKPVRLALEMNQGWFAQRGIRPGAKLRGLERFLAR